MYRFLKNSQPLWHNNIIMVYRLTASMSSCAFGHDYIDVTQCIPWCMYMHMPDSKTPGPVTMDFTIFAKSTQVRGGSRNFCMVELWVKLRVKRANIYCDHAHFQGHSFLFLVFLIQSFAGYLSVPACRALFWFAIYIYNPNIRKELYDIIDVSYWHYCPCSPFPFSYCLWQVANLQSSVSQILEHEYRPVGTAAHIATTISTAAHTIDKASLRSCE